MPTTTATATATAINTTVSCRDMYEYCACIEAEGLYTLPADEPSRARLVFSSGCTYLGKVRDLDGWVFFAPEKKPSEGVLEELASGDGPIAIAAEAWLAETRPAIFRRYGRDWTVHHCSRCERPVGIQAYWVTSYPCPWCGHNPE